MTLKEVSGVMAVILAAVLFVARPVPAQEAGAVYQNPAKPLDQRVDDLVGRMTLEEKASQMVNHTRAIPRLGVPEYNLTLEARDLSHVDGEGSRLVGAGKYGLTIGGGQPGTSAVVSAAEFEVRGEKRLPR